jgi:hypothetical protein
MINIENDVTIIKDPSGIKNAQLASSPYVLRKVFATDPSIRRLIESREKIIPIIEKEIGKRENLIDYTISHLHLLSKM